MSIELHIAELRGFLNAIQRLCGPSHRFYASVIESAPDLESALKSYFAGFEGGSTYLGSAPISFAQVKDQFQKYAFSNLGALEASALQELAWQLIEYYGLASTAVNGPFNSMVSEGALLLSVAQSNYKQCTYFAVRVPGHLIITGLGIRA